MSVKVAVRVRPFNQREKFLGCLCCIQMKDRTTILINPRDRNQKQHQFTFDYSLWSHDGYEELENGYFFPVDDRFVDQKKIFEELGEEIITNAWKGFNCCLFAYGQTGAGKSYSMIGYEANRGIVPMACQRIFQGIRQNQVTGRKQFEVTISMLEIYNEKVQDLFVHTNQRPANGLRIRENRSMGIYVEGITKYKVHSYEEIERRMEQGAKHRSLAATLMNEYSSRAHTIVMIEFIQKQWITEQKMNKKSSILSLVDLAGSERVSKTGISNKDRLKEASQINKSLHTLGRVIEHLADISAGKSKTISVPYRESALTRILQTALGGNSVTTMICAISPANDNYEETLSTLRYADQTKKIRNKPIINESAVDKIIRELREENSRLKEMLRVVKLKGVNLGEDPRNLEASISEIQREIRKNMQSFAINTDELNEDESTVMMTEFIDLPEPGDISSLSDQKCNAYVTNISEDPMLSYKIKYPCDQDLYIGNKNLKEADNRLILCGLGIEDRHARIYEKDDVFYVEPLCDAAAEYTLVNGRPIDCRTEILHNDRLIFGTNCVFLFKNTLSPFSRSTGTVKVISGNKNRSSVSPSTMPVEVTPFSVAASSEINLDESLLLDDDFQSHSSIGKFHTEHIMVESDGLHTIHERDIDYEFAINERQSKLETSTSMYAAINSNHEEMNEKLQAIQSEFEQLLKENEMKIQQKEKQFREKLQRIEKEREAETTRLKEELRKKQEHSIAIQLQKQRIEKARDRLIELEKSRRQSADKADGSQPAIQYVDVHHHDFHYDYSPVPTSISNGHTKEQLLTQQSERGKDSKINMTTSTTVFNQQNADQSLLIEDRMADSNGNHPISVMTKNNANQQASKIHGEQREAKMEPDRERMTTGPELDMTEILYGSAPKAEQEKGSYSNQHEESNLFDLTEQELVSYLPENTTQDHDDDLTFNLSVFSDGPQVDLLREEELSLKIRQLEAKLRTLEDQKQANTQNIKNIRQSFAVGVGEEPNSDNFFIEGEIQFEEGDLDLSAIPARGYSDHLEGIDFEKKLKLSMIQCQNENIINERNLEVRKRKREGEELQEMFIRRERREISKKLIGLIPMLERFNLWAREMSRNLQAKIDIAYKYFTNHQIVEALKNSTFKSLISVHIKVYNYEEGRVYKWPISTFENRYEIIQDLFLKFIENPTLDYFSEKQKDPFWDPKEFQGHSTAYLSLQFLSYAIPYEGDISFVRNGKIMATMQVSLKPNADSELKKKLRDETVSGVEISDPRQLLERDLYFTICINKITPTSDFPSDKVSQFYISYSLLEDNYRHKTYCTPSKKFGTQTLSVMYAFQHSFQEITENTLAYIADCPVCFTLNLMFEYDEQLSAMTSSFIQSSEASFLNSSSLSSKSELDTSKVGSSQCADFNKKSAIIMENTDVLGKIEKDFNNSEKKKEKATDSSGKTVKSSEKKKKRYRDECVIF